MMTVLTQTFDSRDGAGSADRGYMVQDAGTFRNRGYVRRFGPGRWIGEVDGRPATDTHKTRHEAIAELVAQPAFPTPYAH